MEENLEALKGSKTIWVKDCKEQVFKDDLELTAERIGIKHNNLKASWAAAKKRIGGSGSTGSEVKEEPGGTYTMDEGELEKKCPFFQRLDGIFCTRPNTSLGTLQNTPQETPQQTPQETPQETQGQTDQEARHSSEAVSPQDSESDLGFRIVERVDGGDIEGDAPAGNSDEESDWETSSKTKRLRSSSGGTSTRGTAARGTATRGKRKMVSVKKVIEERQSFELERELKRAKIEREMQKERLEAKERLARINASTTTEVAKIQAEAQVRQFELLTQVLRLQAGANSHQEANSGSHRNGD